MCAIESSFLYYASCFKQAVVSESSPGSSCLYLDVQLTPVIHCSNKELGFGSSVSFWAVDYFGYGLIGLWRPPGRDIVIVICSLILVVSVMGVF